MPQTTKRSPLVAGIIIAIVIGLIATYSSLFSSTSSSNTSQTQNQTATKQSVSYAGKDGVDALTLLKTTHQVDASDQGFVNAIDGVKPADKQYWALYVNGQASDKGAKDTITKSTDTVEWKIIGF